MFAYILYFFLYFCSYIFPSIIIHFLFCSYFILFMSPSLNLLIYFTFIIQHSISSSFQSSLPSVSHFTFTFIFSIYILLSFSVFTFSYTVLYLSLFLSLYSISKSSFLCLSSITAFVLPLACFFYFLYPKCTNHVIFLNPNAINKLIFVSFSSAISRSK